MNLLLSHRWNAITSILWCCHTSCFISEIMIPFVLFSVLLSHLYQRCSIKPLTYKRIWVIIFSFSYADNTAHLNYAVLLYGRPFEVSEAQWFQKYWILKRNKLFVWKENRLEQRIVWKLPNAVEISQKERHNTLISEYMDSQH